MQDLLGEAEQLVFAPDACAEINTSQRIMDADENEPQLSRPAIIAIGAVSLVVGLLLMTGFLLVLINPHDKDPETSVAVTGLVVGIVGFFLAYAGLRLVLNRPRGSGTLLPPALLRVLGTIFVVLPLGSLTQLEDVTLYNVLVVSGAIASCWFFARLCFAAATNNEDADNVITAPRNDF